MPRRVRLQIVTQSNQKSIANIVRPRKLTGFEEKNELKILILYLQYYSMLQIHQLFNRKSQKDKQLFRWKITI